MKTINTKLNSKLEQKPQFLHISVPYDKDDKYGLISFDDGLMTELECEEGFVPPMLNVETQRLEVTVDLFERKVIDWDYNDYLRMWAKVCDSGTYTLLDADLSPLLQINGYVPNAMIPPTRMVSAIIWSWQLNMTDRCPIGNPFPISLILLKMAKRQNRSRPINGIGPRMLITMSCVINSTMKR